MPLLNVHGQTYDIDGILFDKDGTLLEFGSLWVDWADELLSTVVSAARLPSSGKNKLANAIGFDAEAKSWDPEGPLCIGSLDDLITILSFRLYENGMPWNQSLELVTNVYTEIDKRNDWDKDIKPVSGLKNFLDKAQASNLKLGVVTSDNHSQAIQHLKALNIDLYFNSVIGHDQVIRGKPFPDMVEKACDQLNMQPERTLIIGDSDGDMMLGKKSDMLASIGIVSEPNSPSDHLINADHVIRNYDDITIDESSLDEGDL